jgi:hypothetical protein
MAQRESLAMRAAHAESVPGLQPFERVVRFQQNEQDLVAACGVRRAPRGGHDTVRIHSVRNDSRLAFERHLGAFMHDRGLARTDVAAGLAFGRR